MGSELEGEDPPKKSDPQHCLPGCPLDSGSLGRDASRQGETCHCRRRGPVSVPVGSCVAVLDPLSSIYYFSRFINDCLTLGGSYLL